MALPNQNLDFLPLIPGASRSDLVLVTLDGVTIAKTRFLVTKSGPFRWVRSARIFQITEIG